MLRMLNSLKLIEEDQLQSALTELKQSVVKTVVLLNQHMFYLMFGEDRSQMTYSPWLVASGECEEVYLALHSWLQYTLVSRQDSFVHWPRQLNWLQSSSEASCGIDIIPGSSPDNTHWHFWWTLKSQQLKLTAQLSMRCVHLATSKLTKSLI